VKLGISSYTFGWAVGVHDYQLARPLDENGLLDKARESGVSLLQIGDNLPLHTFAQSRLAQLADRAARESVQLEVGARGLTTPRLRNYVRIARSVGAKLIRFVIDDADYHPAPKTVTALLRDAAPLLDGLVLAIENHDRFPATTLRGMLEDVGTERIGVCLDTANSIGAGEGLETVLRELAPLTVNLHIKDFHIARVPHLMGFTVEGRPTGSGVLNIPGLLKYVATFDRCQTAVLELWTPPEPRLEDTIAKEAAWAVQSLDYLKPLFLSSR
jgi:3-oxoisoapionate decarboxylase